MLIQAVYKYPYPLCLKLVFFAVERQQRIMHSTWPGQDGSRASQPVVRISLTANPEACITILLRKSDWFLAGCCVFLLQVQTRCDSIQELEYYWDSLATELMSVSTESLWICASGLGDVS